MKKTISLLIFSITIGLLPLKASAQNTTQKEKELKEIALLGVFHFAGTNDMVSMKIEDLNSPKRQEEILKLVERLASLKPDKIILEYPFGKKKLDSLYQQYKEGNHELSINERQQLGFRIAKLLGHEHIYVADHRMDIAFEPLMEYLKETEQTYKLEKLMKEADTQMRKWEALYKNGSLTDLLKEMNTEASDNENMNIYLQDLNLMGETDNDSGIMVASKWWERNLRIMKNIDMLMEPGERALVIFGQGHTAILKGFYQIRTDVRLIDIQKHL